MEQVLYSKLIVPAKESPDGESPTILYVTEESNGIAVLLVEYDHYFGRMLRWFGPTYKNEAIEFGVNKAENMMIAHADKKHLAVV